MQQEIRCARVSAFTRDPFAGNPAAVCPLVEWLPDELMQRIAAEDPVTGSAHSTLTPYWSERLRRPELRARQVGPRGGELVCDLVGDRVRLTGHAVLVFDGVFYLP